MTIPGPRTNSCKSCWGQPPYGDHMSLPLTAHQSVSDRQAFVAFLAQLTQEYHQHGEEWENPTLDRFLEALTAWVQSGPGWYERHLGESLPAAGNWTYFAHALKAATMYE